MRCSKKQCCDSHLFEGDIDIFKDSSLTIAKTKNSYMEWTRILNSGTLY